MRSLSTVGPGDWPTIAAHRNPAAPAVRTPDGVVVNYGDFESRATRLAIAFEAAGVRSGDRIAILATDSVDYAVTLFASFKLGTIAVPLNFRLTEHELADLMRIAEPTVFVLGGRYEPMRAALVAVCSQAPLLQLSIDGSAPSIAGLIADAPAGHSLAARSVDDDTLLWMLTSGTTGTPRVVAQSQRMIKANTVKGIVEQAFAPDDCLYAGTPLFHTAGSGWLFWAMARGACSMIMPQFDAGAVLDCLQQGWITRCLLVPSMAVAILDHPQLDGPYPALRSIAYGGAAMPPSIVQRMHDTFGCDLYNTFGAGTEGGGQTILRPEDHRLAFAGQPRLLGSIGRPMYGVDLQLRDDAGAEVPVGTVGEIWTRSDTVMSGYVGLDDLTAQRVVDGWVRGGDMASRDEAGYLYLAGRKDDMILRGGENIFPAEIENVIAEHPAVAEVAVVGLPDDYWGHVVAAAIVVRSGFVAGFDGAAVIEHCRGRVASYKLPTRVAVVSELPRNGTGKTSKAAVVDLLSRPAGMSPPA
jgi:acyl-CoA synthetase (AMP-forming)/AMP-acid ligase II